MSFFAKLFSQKASIKPRQRSGATIRFLCKAFFLAKESGCIIPCSSIYRRSVCLRGGTLRFPPLKLPSLKGLPVTVAGHWVLPLSYCACAPGASAFGTLSGRSRLIARPPLILATFVASALLACKCSQSSFACGLRARRQPPRTRVLNMPQRASTNIGNRALPKKKAWQNHYAGTRLLRRRSKARDYPQAATAG